MKYLIIFDANCRVCSHSISFIEKRDKKGVFTFLGMKDTKTKELINMYAIKNFDEDTLILIKKENIYLRAEAILEITKEISLPWSFFQVLKIVPLPLLDTLYKIFAKNRHKILSKKSKCKIT